MKGTSLKEDLDRLRQAFFDLWPPTIKNLSDQTPYDRRPRGKLGWFFHSLMNVPVEATRRGVQKWTKIYLLNLQR